MTATPSKPNYAPFEPNLDGAIAAANYLMTVQGYGIRDYPSNMAGLVAAILNLNVGQSNVGITTPQWAPIRDEDGNITADSFDPPPSNGTLWFDTRQGKLMVWVNDGFYQANGTDRFSSVGESIPEDPIEGQTWLDTDNYIYYIFDGNLWIELASMAGSSGGDGGGVSNVVIADLQQQIDNITLDVTPEEIVALQTQITNLSTDTTTQIGSLQTQITEIDKDAIDAKLTELEALIAGQTTSITTLETTSTDHGTRLTAAETSISTNTSDIATINTDLTALQTQVTDIDTLLGTTASELASLRKIYYGDSAPTYSGVQNGDLWVDSTELRLLVRSAGAWFNPDRNASDDDSSETLIINAVNNSTTFDEFKTFINANT